MGENDLVECSLSLETKVARTPGIDSLGPAGDDSLNQFIGRPADARGHFVARNTAKRLDLFADGAGYARHRKIEPRADLLARKTRGMDEKSDRCARASMRVANAFGDRKECFLAGEGLPDDSGEKARSGLVRLAGAHANCGQPDADPVEDTAPRVVGEQELADRLLSSIGCKRGQMKFVGNRMRERRAENSDR